MASHANLDDRLLDFAVSIASTAEALPSTRFGRHAAAQLIRSGTAPGAVYAEARDAESRRDFVHKLKIALKELRETYFWLRCIDRMELAHDQPPAVTECDELIAIFVASIRTARRNDRERGREGDDQPTD